MRSEKISVVVPVYNVKDYLARCIESILVQTYTEIEIILVDDGSTDGSGSICDLYASQDRRIRVLHKENGGLSSARNVGIDMATGSYLSFIDSDDWIIKDMFQHLIEIIKKTNSDCANINFVRLDDTVYESNEKITINTFQGKDILREYLYEGTRRGSYACWRYLYKKELFDNVRFPLGRINEDIATNYKVLMNAKKMVKSNYVAYFYYQNRNSITRAGLKKRDFDLLIACSDLKELAKNEKYKDINKLVNIKVARSYFSLLAKISFYGVEDNEINKQDVIKELTKSLRKNYLTILNSPIPLNRKLMATALSININCLTIPLNIYKKIKGK